MEHKEKQEIKWADVARYYAASGINGRFNRMLAELVGVDGDLAILFVGVVDGARQRRVVDFGSFTPILRALEDMTQKDADEYISKFTTYQKFIGTPSAVTLALESIDHGLWRIERGGASVTHWLISKGFDVFGLIESGQAIRKPIG